jgi:hypothetical protein
MFKLYNNMDQQQENNYGSRRWLILGPFLTDMDIQTSDGRIFVYIWIFEYCPLNIQYSNTNIDF